MISDPITLEPGTTAPTIADNPNQGNTIAPALLFSVPPNDPAFARLPHECREDVRLTLARLKQIHYAPNQIRECERIAALLQAGCNGGRGITASSLQRKYYDYTRYGKAVDGGKLFFSAGDWRTIANWAKAGRRALQVPSDSLPAAFVQTFWRLLCEKHQRVCSEAYRELIQLWKTGFDSQGNRVKQIAGYPDWPQADPRTGIPAGWGDRNLYRHAPDKFERTSARIGIQAASAVGLKLRTTRVGLKVLEFIQGDDHEFNVKVNFPGQLRSLRPRCFAFADVLTSRLFKFVSKPTFWNEEEQAKKVLNETDFMWFALAALTDEGYRTDTGTTIQSEHGTAALREELAERILQYTGGKVRVARSGRFHKSAHGGQFAAPSGGNFRFKAIIEGFWRLFDDRLDSLPGQVGKDRLHAPEELERADAYTNKLLKASAALDPEQAAELVMQRLTWEEFIGAVWEKASQLDADFNHEIEGWAKCGFVLKEFRRTQAALDWQPLAALAAIPDESERNALAVAVLQNDQLFRTRKLSRFEAWQVTYQRDRESGLIARLSPELIPAIVGPRHALKCNGSPFHTVRHGVISFEDERIDSDPLVFVAVDQSGERFPEGSKFICYVNPMSPSCLVACDKDHRVIAVCPPMPRPAVNDVEGIKASMGMQRSWYARALAPQRQRHAPDAAQLAFMRKHNSAILEGGKTEAEKQRGKTLRRAKLDAGELLEASEQISDAQTDGLTPSESSSENLCASPAFDPSELL